MGRARELASELFGIDLRSLAVFRIALGSLLLWDLADRSRDLVAHYTDAGVLPGDLVSALGGRGADLSVHVWASGSPAAVALLFALAAAAALALVLGYRTRLATLVCWYLLISLQVRNPWAAAMGGDKLLRLLVFWSLFLPLGARFSLDARRNPSLRETANWIASPATAALLLQVALMYWITAFRKDGPDWFSGEAVYFALNLDMYATAFGVWLRELGWLLPLMTWGTLAFEFLGPLLAFSPIRTGWCRLVAIALFVAFHLALASSLSIGYFPAVSIVAWCAYLPREFWERLVPRLRGRPAVSETPGLRSLESPRWVRALAAACLAYVILFLLPQIPQLQLPELPRQVTFVGRVLRINQYWTMFAPQPSNLDVWPEVHGRLESGQPIDVLRGGAPRRIKPASVIATWRGFRWRLYWAKLLAARPDSPLFEPSLRNLAQYYCETPPPGSAPDERLAFVQIIRVTEDTSNPYPRDYQVLFETPCPAADEGASGGSGSRARLLPGTRSRPLGL